jgi:hypothetical protein
MDKFAVWHTFSATWTEIGLDGDDIAHDAKTLRNSYQDWGDIDKIIFRDICLSFSIESALVLVAVFPPLILLVGVSPWPDWGYETEYLNNRAKKWYSTPYWLHLLNPIRLVGYPLAVLFVLSLRSKLKKSFLSQHIT